METVVCGEEKKMIKELEASVGFDNSKVYRYFTYRLTNWCNYRCSYCVQGNKVHDDCPKLESTEYYVNDAKLCRRFLDELNEDFPVPFEKITLIGGEVGLIDLKEVVKEIITDRLAILNITTNLSVIRNFIEVYKVVSDYNKEHNTNIKVNVSASFHEEFASLDKFIANYKELDKASVEICGRKDSIGLEMVVHDDNLDIAKEFLKRCDEENVKRCCINIKRDRLSVIMKGETEGSPVTEKTVKWIEENYNTRGGSRTSQYYAKYDDGSEGTISRLDLVNCNTSGLAEGFTGWICKDRHRMVRKDEHGFRFSCGNVCGRNPKDIICPQKYCSLCGYVHLEKRD